MSWQLAFSPRRWQAEALEAWERETKGVVKVVTGGGKTAFAELCMQRYREMHPDARFVIIVPSIALLDQWLLSLQSDLSVDPSDIACYSGEERPSSPRVVNIVVVNTARTKAAELAVSPHVFLVADECHRLASPANSRALAAGADAKLGLSATPERQYDEGFESVVSPALGPVVYDYDHKAALADGAIAPFELTNVRVPLIDKEQADYDRLSVRIARLMESLGEAAQSEPNVKRLLLRRASVSANAVTRSVVAARIVEQHAGRRVIVFHERLDRANTIHRLLCERHLRATIYHTGIGPSLRRDNLNLYRLGAYDILVTCRALDEGLNVPDTEVAVLAATTASYRQRIQRVGRVLRPSPGKERALVYTLYATDQEERRLAKEAATLVDVTQVRWLHGTVGRRG